MQDLTLVGVHDDGEHLVLATPDGHKFRVRVDETLRAAVRRDRPRLGQLQIEQDGRLRPRDIQARIRAGESAEGIAESSGLAIEYIRRYEGPVLAEREFVVRQARAVRMRGISRVDGSVPTLGELVTERLAAREVQHSDSSWDAWRSDERSWTVTLSFTAGTRDRVASWLYDPTLRQVGAKDDEARWLSDSEQPASSSPGAATYRRLVPVRPKDASGEDGDGVRDRVYDVGADGSVQAWPAASTVDLLDTLRERRGRRQRLAQHPDDLGDLSDLSALDGDFTSDFTDADLDLPPAAHPPASRAGRATDAEVLALPDTDAVRSQQRVPRPGPPPGESHSGPSGLPSNEVPDTPPSGMPLAAQTAPSARGGQPVRRGKRASVPSWDDIVFGSRRE
jgi:hypothetical protein